MEFAALIAKFGEVEHNGKQLALMQEAYCSNNPNAETYEAKAVDADGNEYKVIWDCTDGWMDREDESEACDWSIYEVREL